MNIKELKTKNTLNLYLWVIVIASANIVAISEASLITLIDSGDYNSLFCYFLIVSVILSFGFIAYAMHKIDKMSNVRCEE